MSKRLVAVVVPVYRDFLTLEEGLAFSRNAMVLRDYPLAVVAPEGLIVPNELATTCERIVRFKPGYFRGLKGYSRLMLSKGFYEQFQEFDYILVCQLDCLVLRNTLESWCARGMDYVGAPWFVGFDHKVSPDLFAVGNGGLSLRRVSTALSILGRTDLCWDRATYLRLPAGAGIGALAAVRTIGALATRWPRLPWGSVLLAYFRVRGIPEDRFWSFYASFLSQPFVIPGPKEALEFAFEVDPRACFALAGNRLPMGIHAWTKYDRAFCEQLLARADEGT